MSSTNGRIDKLDFPPQGDRRPLLRGRDDVPSSGRSSRDASNTGSFFEQVAEGIQERDRRIVQRELVRYLSFLWAVLNCLCAGSITAYSLYGHLFQSRLRYSQYQVNIVSIAAELGMYLPVPAFGYLCDRYGPGIPSVLSGLLFGFSYLLAALTYRSGPPPASGGSGWPFAAMVIAFVGVGMGTCCMYLSAVTTSAKNFGRGKYKGLALAIPIACFGLSGMWQSQFGSRVLYERSPDGARGDVDVFRFFVFLACTLLAVGLLGGFMLRVVDEEQMIDEAVEELERSGLLNDDEYFHRAAHRHGYGTMSEADMSDSQVHMIRSEAEQLKLQAEEEQRKKTWLLNEETRLFLTDRTMWLVAAGFFLVTGPGEAFINNMGTIIGTLYPSGTPPEDIPTSAATHVSIVAITSTLARLVTGTLSDLFAPVAPSHQHRRGPAFLSSSISSLPSGHDMSSNSRISISRVSFLLTFSLLLSLGQVLLASGFVQNHAERFAAVSALVGAGYGAVFSLVPIIVSVVWGVENFGTNWGIVATVPAAGAAVWGLVYSAVYQNAAGRSVDVTPASGLTAGQASGPTVSTVEDVLCYGIRCYAPTFWAMAVSVWLACLLWAWAWRGPGGWMRRGIAV